MLLEAGTGTLAAAAKEEKTSLVERVVDLLTKEYHFGNFWMTGWVILIWILIVICIVLAVGCLILISDRKKQTGVLAENIQGSGNTAEPGVETEQEPEPKSISAESAGLPVVGKLHDIGMRKDQQDSFGVSDAADSELYEQKGLFAVVADGMGGLADGGLVSAESVKTCLGMFYDELGSGDAAARLLKMAARVNRNVNRILSGKTQRSGSTLVEALIYQGKLNYLTVGDSRIYLYRQGGLICLNRPHIYAEEIALEAVNGRSDIRQMETDSQRKSLTSYIGAGELKHLDRSEEGVTLMEGDKIMLASDGVFGTLTEQQMADALAMDAQQAADRMKALIQKAQKAHQDNYTAVVLEYHGE